MRNRIVLLGVLMFVVAAFAAMGGSMSVSEKAAPQFVSFSAGEMKSLTGGGYFPNKRCGNETPPCYIWGCWALTYEICKVDATGWKCEDEKSPAQPYCFNWEPGSGPCSSNPEPHGWCDEWQ